MTEAIDSALRSLTAVTDTLNHVEVHGEKNLNALLASLQAIRSACRNLSEAAEKEAAK